MKRNICRIPALILLLYTLTACGNQTDMISRNPKLGISENDTDQKYMKYLEDQIKEAFAGRDDIDSIDVEISSGTDQWTVNVKIHYSDSLSDTSEMTQSIEDALTKFLPEGTELSVTVE